MLRARSASPALALLLCYAAGALGTMIQNIRTL
jgi:hypothetical protein